MENCIFCKIIKGEIPSVKVFEDKDVLVFLDVAPLTKGHCLVVPKKHAENIFDIDDEDLKKVIVVAKNISRKIKNSLHVDGIRISQSNGEAAGQVISHFHLHIIPRYKDDGVNMSETSVARPKMVDITELKELAEKIKI